MEKERNNRTEDSERLDLVVILDDMWRGVKKFYWLLILIVSISSMLFYIQARRSYTPMYEAYSSFVVNAATDYQYNSTYYNKTTAEQLSKTFPYILTSGALNQVVAESLGMSSVPATITAEAMEDMPMFTIRVTAGDAQMAYDVLRAVIDNYPSVAEYIIGDTQLTMMDESGIPENVSNPPRYFSNVKKGIAFGGILCVAFLVIYAMTRNTVRRGEDLEKHLSMTNLGSVPKVKLKKRSNMEKQQQVMMDREDVSAVLGESMRAIRIRLAKEMKRNNTRCVMVTSATEKEGKTTFAANLALTFARKDKKVILIDLDLRNPTVASAMGIHNIEYGLEDVLNETVEIDKALYSYEETALQILPVKQKISDPIKILGSDRMKMVLEELSQTADLILIDTPPCAIISDATVIARYVQAAVFVVRQDYARIHQIVSGVETLTDTGVKMLGYVLNGVEAGITEYGYGYGYRYRSYSLAYGANRKKEEKERQEFIE